MDINNYNQQQNAPRLRRRRRRKAKGNTNSSSINIDQHEGEQQPKALEGVNMKKGLEMKFGKENNGHENGKGLGLTAKEEPIQHLSRSQRQRLRRRLRKEAEDAERNTEKVSGTLVDKFVQSSTAKFSVKDPCTPEFLNAIAHCYNSDIKLMQLRLEVTDALIPNDNEQDIIIAKIFMDNMENIANHVFEFIRTDLIGWIGAYQREDLDTPIFHGIENNKGHIKIICENDYAYNCLEQCINEMSGLKSIGSLQLYRQPPVTPIIYCFDFIYEGLARDADLFLTQLRMHKPKLNTKIWMVATHDVCLQESVTYFIFLVDERSALALNFQYSRSFCVCLQTVKFRCRGVVAKGILY